MPNWCNNTIEIQGSTETVKQIWDDAHWTETRVNQESGETETINCFGLLQAISPMPKELEGTTSPSDEPNWYDWRVSNWGTKWDIDGEGLEYTDNGDGTSTIAGWFDSAWSPPIEAYNSFLDQFDGCSLYATYEEGGMDFAGIYDNGADDFMEDISSWCRKVVAGEVELEDTPDLFQRLDEEFDLVENRREWIEEELEEENQDA